MKKKLSPILDRIIQLKYASEKVDSSTIKKCVNDEYGTKFSKEEIDNILKNSFLSDDFSEIDRNYTSEILPEISVIVPVYETEVYLKECINSLVNQTERSLEIIIVNDCSPDRCNDIVLEFMLKDLRVKYVQNVKNMGLLLTRQSGVAFAKGSYITHLDSDDFLSFDTYRKVLEKAHRTSADIVQFGMMQLREGKLKPHRVSISEYERLDGVLIFEAFLKNKINFSVCNKLYKRNLWIKSSKYFPKISYMVEDLSQNLVLMYDAKIYVSIPDVCHFYRITPNSDSRSKDIDSLGWRAFSAVRHIAKLKIRLKQKDQLTRHWPLFGSFEKRIYSDYFRPLLKSCDLLGELEPEKILVINKEYDRKKSCKLTIHEICMFWIKKIYRINGYLPIRPYIPLNNPISKRILRMPSNKNERPKVSIIIPVYNISEYLGECLASACGQTLEDIEIIVVNDASTDTSSRIISEFTGLDSRVRRIDHKFNRGLLQSRLSGVKVARGKYITHLDGDDYIEPEMFEVMYMKAQEKEADVVQCGYRTVKGDKHKNVLCQGGRHMKDNDILKNFLTLDGMSNSMWNKLLKREIWAVSLPYFPQITYKAEDVCLNTVLMSFATHLEHIPKPYYNYRIREGSGDRIQNPDNICFRAVSACHNMRQIEYVTSTFKSPEFFSEGLRIRMRVYFRKALGALIDFSNINPKLATNTLITCYAITDWSYVKYISNIIIQRQSQTSLSSNNLYSSNSPSGFFVNKFLNFEKMIVKIFWREKQFIKYCEDRNRFFKDSKHSIFRVLAK